MSEKSESAAELIDQRIEELGDWRGETLARVRALVKQADPGAHRCHPRAAAVGTGHHCVEDPPPAPLRRGPRVPPVPGEEPAVTARTSVPEQVIRDTLMPSSTRDACTNRNEPAAAVTCPSPNTERNASEAPCGSDAS